MSTGANCRFIEEKPGEWYYEIQEWPYGDTPDYEVHGPFTSQEEAMKHLDDNYANPGGWSEFEHDSNFVRRLAKKPSDKMAEQRRGW